MHRLSCSFFVLAVSCLLVPAAMAQGVVDGTISVMGSAPDGRGGYVIRKAMVDVSDLDVKKAENASVILGRLQNAAAAICKARQAVNRDLAEKLQKCRSRAVANAVAELDSAELKRLASEH